MGLYVEEFGQLGGVSVRTLHYYDAIGLLKPKGRLINGYRVYAKADLLKLRQIVWLRSLGFGLSKIKALFLKEKGNDICEHFYVQKQLIEKKLMHLQKVHEILTQVMKSCEGKKSVDLKKILKLVEAYRAKLKLNQPGCLVQS